MTGAKLDTKGHVFRGVMFLDYRKGGFQQVYQCKCGACVTRERKTGKDATVTTAEFGICLIKHGQDGQK